MIVEVNRYFKEQGSTWVKSKTYKEDWSNSEYVDFISNISVSDTRYTFQYKSEMGYNTISKIVFTSNDYLKTEWIFK